MSAGTLESRFVAACSSVGEPYVSIRKALVAEAASDSGATREFLEREVGGDDAPRRRLVAEILLTHVRDAAGAKSFQVYVHGNVPHTDPLPVPGATVNMRAQAILSLREQAFPLALEMLWLARDWQSRTALSTLVVVLGALKDERAVSPMTELLGDEASPVSLRALAAGVLAQTAIPATLPTLIATAEDPSTPPAVREAVIHGLHYFRDPCTSGVLVGILERDGHGSAEREAAALALGQLEQASLRDPIRWLLAREKSDRVAGSLVLAMDGWATPADIPFLRDLALRGGTAVQRSVEAVVQEIERRNAPRTSP